MNIDVLGDAAFLGQAGLWAAIAAVALSVVIVAGAAAAPDALLDDYPPALKERYGEQSRRGRRADALMSVAMLVVAVVTAIAGILATGAAIDADIGFAGGFALGVFTAVLLTVVDTVVIDWLLFCRLQLPVFVLPGTEGDPAYRDYAFHVRVLWPRGVAVVVAAGVAYGLLALVVEAVR